MKSKLIVSLLVVGAMLCPAFAFAAEQQNPVAVDETVAVAENTTTGDAVGEAVETDELYAPTTKPVKDAAEEAKESATEEAKETSKEDVKM